MAQTGYCECLRRIPKWPTDSEVLRVREPPIRDPASDSFAAKLESVKISLSHSHPAMLV